MYKKQNSNKTPQKLDENLTFGDVFILIIKKNTGWAIQF